MDFYQEFNRLKPKKLANRTTYLTTVKELYKNSNDYAFSLHKWH